MLLVQVSVVLKCKMSAYQAAIYDWVKTTGTLRLDPDDEAQRIAGNSKRLARAYAPLQNKCMELRKVCNHPYLNYPPRFHGQGDMSVRTCGKLWILDRILVKLHKTGHRVLLFSTMTRLLDILEDYLQWRRLIYRRIDGMTTLEARESAIVEFNRPNSDCFIFLLSIRAAGRGLNLQTADTVIVYDPDPNPKNEEQAVARAHRIGQKREVRVIYMEAVVESTPSYEKEDELRSGGSLDEKDDELVTQDLAIIKLLVLLFLVVQPVCDANLEIFSFIFFTCIFCSCILVLPCGFIVVASRLCEGVGPDPLCLWLRLVRIGMWALSRAWFATIFSSIKSIWLMRSLMPGGSINGPPRRRDD